MKPRISTLSVAGWNSHPRRGLFFLRRVGFSVEYAVHIVERWMRCDAAITSGLERVRYTMSFLTLPTFMSFVSSAIGVCCLAFTAFDFNETYFFRTFCVGVRSSAFFDSSNDCVIYYPRAADSRNAGHLFLWLLVAPVAIGVARGRRGPTGVSFFFLFVLIMVVVEKRLGHSNHPAPAYCTLIRFGNSHLEKKRSILYSVQHVGTPIVNSRLGRVARLRTCSISSRCRVVQKFA
jgi:Patched family